MTISLKWLRRCLFVLYAWCKIHSVPRRLWRCTMTMLSLATSAERTRPGESGFSSRRRSKGGIYWHSDVPRKVNESDESDEAEGVTANESDVDVIVAILV
ncbi:hypothetical protein GY45DRAFT_343548 [Cubamyces sp. BRFM 1775]|nr:hypothetical protein GY45DRAFT_343548 [Cubamyces sp. BRFM 1775]